MGAYALVGVKLGNYTAQTGIFEVDKFIVLDLMNLSKIEVGLKFLRERAEYFCVTEDTTDYDEFGLISSGIYKNKVYASESEFCCCNSEDDLDKLTFDTFDFSENGVVVINDKIIDISEEQFLVYESNGSENGKNDGNTYKAEIIPLVENGDFRSAECLEYLEECDIVVTNPPFSLFKEFIRTLRSYNKKFLVVGNKNAITYKGVFDLIRDNRMWLGYSNISILDLPDGTERKDGGLSRCFTNLEIKKRYEDLILYKTYSETAYPKYDNYDAINVDKVKDIPMNYGGVMGVPISFIDKYNPNQFEIVGLTESGYRGASNGIWSESSGVCQALINGKKKYQRLFIKRRHS